MSRAQRKIVLPTVLVLILLAVTVGVILGTVPQHQWDVLLARVQNLQVNSVAPATHTQATLYILDAAQPVRQEMMIDLRVSEYKYGNPSSSIPILLTADAGTVEMPLDNGLFLRMELVQDAYYMEDEPEPFPLMSPAQIAGW
jgi:hypothetical protein